MRTRGSARFEPYFKVQRWEPRSHAWMDIQRQHATEEEARAAFPPGKARVVRISMEGREPIG